MIEVAVGQEVVVGRIEVVGHELADLLVYVGDAVEALDGIVHAILQGGDTLVGDRGLVGRAVAREVGADGLCESLQQVGDGCCDGVHVGLLCFCPRPGLVEDRPLPGLAPGARLAGTGGVAIGATWTLWYQSLREQ